MKIYNNFPKLSGVLGWIRNIKHNFLILLRLIKFHCPPKLINRQLIGFFIHIFIYPPVRIILGKTKTGIIGASFFNVRYPTVFPLPYPLKSKIAVEQINPGLYDEIYIRDIYFSNTLKENMNVVDVGANIGAYTVLAAEKIGKTGKVIAIEPEPKNYKQLIGNIKLNNFQNVIAKNIALTDHTGFEKLYISSDSESHSLVLKEDKVSFIEVSVKTLDELLKELNLRRIDVIKIDAEGAELKILKGARETLIKNPQVKIAIAAYHFPSEVEEINNYLKRFNFSPVIIPGVFPMVIVK